MADLPGNVTSLLKSTRFVHLATSFGDIPHVTLMNYTYYQDEQVIIVTTPKDSTKYTNMVSNPNVSLLVHDWISAKSSAEPTVGERRNSLYELLANLNKNEISRVSVMLSGKSELIDPELSKFKFYYSLHQNNSKIDQVQAENYIKCKNTALFVIKIEGCKVTDTDNKVEEY